MAIVCNPTLCPNPGPPTLPTAQCGNQLRNSSIMRLIAVHCGYNLTGLLSVNSSVVLSVISNLWNNGALDNPNTRAFVTPKLKGAGFTNEDPTELILDNCGAVKNIKGASTLELTSTAAWDLPGIFGTLGPDIIQYGEQIFWEHLQDENVGYNWLAIQCDGVIRPILDCATGAIATLNPYISMQTVEANDCLKYDEWKIKLTAKCGAKLGQPITTINDPSFPTLNEWK